MNTQASIAILEHLASLGVRHATLCPGSRSTPLALAVDAHPDIETTIHIDERGAAFHALGVALGTGRPAAVITTSGTAVSNLWPAMTEAHQANVPLVALTADRPPRLRDTGSNQTIDQVDLFDRVARSSVDLPMPDAHAIPPSIADALGSYPLGPIHLNQPFDKPLEPDGGGHEALRALAKQARRETKPPAQPQPSGDLPQVSLGHLGPRGLIVCGPKTGRHLAPAIRRLAAALQAPIVADCLSGLRFAGLDVVSGADRFADLDALPKADWVVQFGATPTSRHLARYLARAENRLRFDWSGRGWDDIGPCDMTDADPARWMDKATKEAAPMPGADAWAALWRAMDAAVADVVPEDHDEAAWVASLLAGAPERIFVGNSMPVRDLERYGRSGATIDVLANRGASGIDGTIATAAGIARSGPTTAIIGDLAFAHDQSSLALWHDALSLVVIDNGGGRIFEHLPVAAATTRFQELFVTPPGLDIETACYAAEVPVHFATPTGLAKLDPGVTIVETPGGEAHKRQALHRQAHEAAGKALAQHL